MSRKPLEPLPGWVLDTRYNFQAMQTHSAMTPLFHMVPARYAGKFAVPKAWKSTVLFGVRTPREWYKPYEPGSVFIHQGLLAHFYQRQLTQWQNQKPYWELRLELKLFDEETNIIYKELTVQQAFPMESKPAGRVEFFDNAANQAWTNWRAFADPL